MVGPVPRGTGVRSVVLVHRTGPSQIDFYTFALGVPINNLPNYLEAKLPIPSGLNIQAWRCLLADFPDVPLVDYLEFGWPLDYTSCQIPVSTMSNHAKDPSDIAHIGRFNQKELGTVYQDIPSRTHGVVYQHILVRHLMWFTNTFLSDTWHGLPTHSY